MARSCCGVCVHFGGRAKWHAHPPAEPVLFSSGYQYGLILTRLATDYAETKEPE